MTRKEGCAALYFAIAVGAVVLLWLSVQNENKLNPSYKMAIKFFKFR